MANDDGIAKGLQGIEAICGVFAKQLQFINERFPPEQSRQISLIDEGNRAAISELRDLILKLPKREQASSLRNLYQVASRSFLFGKMFGSLQDDLAEYAVNARASNARKGRAVTSDATQRIVEKHSRDVWAKNRKRCTSDSGTATDILNLVNADLAAAGLPTKGKDAVRKRVAKIKNRDG
jgi:hypothetical protein